MVTKSIIFLDIHSKKQCADSNHAPLGYEPSTLPLRHSISYYNSHKVKKWSKFENLQKYDAFRDHLLSIKEKLCYKKKIKPWLGKTEYWLLLSETCLQNFANKLFFHLWKELFSNLFKRSWLAHIFAKTELNKD